MSRVFFTVLAAVVAVGSPVALSAQAVAMTQYDYAVEPPVSWNASLSELEGALKFAPAGGDVVMTTVPVGRTAGDPLVKMDAHVEETGYVILQKERETFKYNGFPAAIGLYQLRTPVGFTFEHILWIDDGKREFWIAVMSSSLTHEERLNEIYSAMDGFSLGAKGRLSPGPVSQYYVPINDAPDRRIELKFGSKRIRYKESADVFDAAQNVVEREASIMKVYNERTPEAFLAWARYYRMVYRDNYGRLEAVYKAIEPLLSRDKSVAAKQLLEFSQNYTYTDGGTFSGLIAPVTALAKSKGDCDSMSLVYIILLNRRGIDAALLLSQDIKHAITAVDVAGEGTRYALDDQTRYLGAELTTKDPLGVMPANVLTANDWFPLLFKGRK